MTNSFNDLIPHNDRDNFYQLIDREDYAQAMQLASQFTQSYPNNPEAWIMLSMAQQDLGLLGQAAASIQRAIDLNPNDARYYWALGTTLAQQDEMAQALPQFSAAYRLDPNKPAFGQYYGYSLFKVGAVNNDPKMVKEGLKLLEKLARSHPEEQQGIEMLAECYLDAVPLGWFPHPEQPGLFVPIRKAHIRQAETFIQKAERLPIQSAEIAADLKNRKKELKGAKGRIFTGRYTPGLIVLLFGFFSLCSGDIVGVLFGILLLGLGITYFVACRRPLYLHNAKVLAGKNLTPFDWVEMGFGRILHGWVFIGPLTNIIFIKAFIWGLETSVYLALLPFVTLFYLYENYLADN